MSYDGGIIARVQNDELLKLMKQFKKQGLFDEAQCICDMIGSKYKKKTMAINYEYMDCAYIDVCPKHLSEVFDAVVMLLDEYCDDVDPDAYAQFKQVLQEQKDLIEASYSYVEWVYAHSDDDDEDEETFLYEHGEEHYTSVE